MFSGASSWTSGKKGHFGGEKVQKLAHFIVMPVSIICYVILGTGVCSSVFCSGHNLLNRK